jgi:hypothetical protein
LQAASRKPQAASRKPQAASRKPQAASRKPQAASRKPSRVERSSPHGHVRPFDRLRFIFPIFVSSRHACGCSSPLADVGPWQSTSIIRRERAHILTLAPLWRGNCRLQDRLAANLVPNHPEEYFMCSIRTFFYRAILMILALQAALFVSVAMADERDDGVEKTLYECKRDGGTIVIVPDLCPPNTTEVGAFQAMIYPGGMYKRIPDNHAPSAAPQAQATTQESGSSPKAPASTPLQKGGGGILYILGLLVFILGFIGILIAAFRTSILWGLCCLLLWPASLFYVILHWEDAKSTFFLCLIGFGITILGASVFG